MDTKRFWMIAVDGVSAPTVRHASFQTAKLEAERLATKTGQRAVVLEAKFACAPIRNVEWASLCDEVTAVARG